MNTRHSLGPWYLEREGPGNRVIRNKYIRVAEILNDCYPDAEQELANAMLMTAATELLEALAWYGEQARLARLIHSEGDKGRQALAADGGEKASAAIRKATGEQS